MPNWCTNEVDIYGGDNLEQFKQFVDECIVTKPFGLIETWTLEFEKVIP